VSFFDSPQGLQISAQLTGVPPGTHGFHIHEFGDCGDAGKAAGGHYNPHGTPHGFLPKDGEQKAHAGDMGNIEIGQDGSGTLTLTLPAASLSTGEHNVGGRAVILHEKSDDFSQPTGNAGGRIGCGIIAVTGK
jgi:Cu-Zn family superoxide dismutase